MAPWRERFPLELGLEGFLFISIPLHTENSEERGGGSFFTLHKAEGVRKQLSPPKNRLALARARSGQEAAFPNNVSLRRNPNYC